MFICCMKPSSNKRDLSCVLLTPGGRLLLIDNEFHCPPRQQDTDESTLEHTCAGLFMWPCEDVDTGPGPGCVATPEVTFKLVFPLKR